MARLATRPILVVEDDDSTAGLLRHVFESEHMLVRTAGSGREALVQAEVEPPDLVLLDLALPDVDGWSVVGALHAIDPARIVLMSASLDAAAVRRGLRAGVGGFLGKPFALRWLLTICRQVLDVAPAFGVERRTAARRRFVAGARVLDMSRRAQLANAVVTDLAADGFGLLAEERLPVGGLAHVALDLVGSPVRLEGRVQWTSPAKDGFRHGVRVALPPALWMPGADEVAIPRGALAQAL